MLNIKNIIIKLKIDVIYRFILGLFLRVYYVFPIKKQIVFISHYGNQYSCNPRYLSESIMDSNSFEKIYWVFKDPLKFEYLKENYNLIKYKSLKYYYILFSSRVVVTNQNFMGHYPFRKKQLLVNTLHGGGAYKKYTSDDNQRWKKMIEKQSNKFDFILSSCKRSSELMIKRDFNYENIILEHGFPRNDMFFSNDIVEKNKRKVFDYYGISADTKIVMYAPTFRDSERNDVYNIDINGIVEILSSKNNDNWFVLTRMHPNVRDMFQINGHQAVDVSDYLDMQELLCATDILITDYSSSIWDFSILKRPILLYTLDLEDYIGERNFYVPIEEWGFPILKNNDELYNYLDNLDGNIFTGICEKHHLKFRSFEQGNATELITQEIVKRL